MDPVRKKALGRAMPKGAKNKCIDPTTSFLKRQRMCHCSWTVFRILYWYRRQNLAWNAPMACEANAHGEFVGIPSGSLWLSFHQLTEFKKRDFTGHIANWEILSAIISRFSPRVNSAWCIVLFLCRNQRSRKDYNSNVGVMLWSSGSGTRF